MTSPLSFEEKACGRLPKARAVVLRPTAFNPSAALIKGVVCGVRVETIADPLMQRLRYLDKLIDELAKGKAMEKILRQG